MNPNEPTDYRFNRGGSWFYIDSSWVRAADRDRNAVSDRNNSLGFRCALRGRTPRV